MTVAELYESRKDDPRWNTSYPLSPQDWEGFRVSGRLPFESEQALSFYIHIPFCKQLCSFCEYTRVLCPNENIQRKYLQTVGNDISLFKSTKKDFTLLGFDIGGGTPTALSDNNFSLLIDIYDTAVYGQSFSDGYEPSIEATFETLTESKLERVVASGIHRLSIGVQSSCVSTLHKHNRGSVSETEMEKWLNTAWKIGIFKINIDFMYGLNGQNAETIDRDIQLISRLKPQQVTLYELRTNMISDKHLPCKEDLFTQYSHYYEGLTKLGYNARFGQNTFSVFQNDQGVSSYLRERMLNGASYKGFGLSAQSMSKAGISYNIGKTGTMLYKHLMADSFLEEYTYLLPPQELASKYIAISAYNGSFSLDRLKSFGVYETAYIDIVNFCLSERLLEIKDNNCLSITKKGFKYYGALFSLFYVPQTK